MLIKYPKSVDLNKYRNDSKEVFYGLPQDIKYCKTCVMSNQKPNSDIEHKNNADRKKKTLGFHSDGRCDACHITEWKNDNTIDWEKRERELADLCDKYRSNNSSYDCLVPGSGGKDSFFQAHILKYKYNMNPLTVTWSPHIYTDWGWENFQSWMNAGFDNYLMTPNIKVRRLLTRLSLENLLHPFQSFIIGQKSFAPKIAAKFNIPLIFYGESDAEYGCGEMEKFNTPLRDMSFSTITDKENLFFGGVSYRSLISDFGLTDSDLSIYTPLHIDNISKSNIQFHDLGYYLKWHPQSCYYYAVEHGGFIASPERTIGTYSKYNSIDDKMDDFHYYTTGIKFGIGRATYDASQEIRSDDITREEGVSLVNKFDHEYPQRFEDDVFKYVSIRSDEYPIASKCFEQPIMDKEYFISLCDNFRSPHLWKFENNQWQLREKVT